MLHMLPVASCQFIKYMPQIHRYMLGTCICQIQDTHTAEGHSQDTVQTQIQLLDWL